MCDIKKEIQFSAKFDTAEFDRSISDMQKKLKEMYAPSDMIRMQNQTGSRMEGAGLGGNMSKASQEQFQRATQQSRREMDQALAREAQQQDRLSKIIEKRESKLKELKKIQDEMIKGTKEELELKEKMSRMEENNFRLRENYRQRDKVLNEGLDMRDQMGPKGFDRMREGYQQGGMKGAISAGADMLKGMGPGGIATMIGGALAAVGGIAKVGGAIYANVKGAGVDTASNSGSATQGIFGRELSGAYSGRSAFEMAFLPEKNRALKMAAEAMKGQRVNNAIGALTSPMDGAVGATLKGAGIGAMVGSAVPLVGTGIGAVAGGIAGFGLNAMSNVANDPKKMALMGSPFSSTMNNQYEAMMAKEFADKYSQALEGLKNDNPMKTMAAEEYQQNYRRNLGAQRSMGLDYGGFHGTGGFRENAINNGFTDEMAMQASGNILGAGGSTRMARDSVFALQASRQFDQTNSSQVLGQLSGSIGSSEGSKQAYIKMLAEGTRVGLDSSEYREESRKFMEATAGVVTGSASTNQSDIARLVSQFGGFVSDKSQKGIEASKTAFETYNSMTSETSGPRGSIRAAAMLQDSTLGSMSAKDRATLAQMNPTQVTSDNQVVQSIAKKYNKSPEEIINSVSGANAQSFSLTAEGDKYSKSVLAAKDQLKALGTGPENEEKRKQLEAQIKQDTGMVAADIQFQNPKMDRRIVDSMTAARTSGNPQDMTEVMKQMEGQMGGKGPRMEDESVAGAAEGSRLVLENFRKFKDDLAPAAEAIKSFNEQLVKTIDIIGKMPASDRAKYYENMGFSTPQNQNQSGKSGR